MLREISNIKGLKSIDYYINCIVFENDIENKVFINLIREVLVGFLTIHIRSRIKDIYLVENMETFVYYISFLLERESYIVDERKLKEILMISFKRYISNRYIKTDMITVIYVVNEYLERYNIKPLLEIIDEGLNTKEIK